MPGCPAGLGQSRVRFPLQGLGKANPYECIRNKWRGLQESSIGTLCESRSLYFFIHFFSFFLKKKINTPKKYYVFLKLIESYLVVFTLGSVEYNFSELDEISLKLSPMLSLVR